MNFQTSKTQPMVKVIVKLKHDTGKLKISVWANSIEEAVNKVLKSENAPKSAVISAIKKVRSR